MTLEPFTYTALMYRESLNNAAFGNRENPRCSSTVVIFDLKNVLFKDYQRDIQGIGTTLVCD